MDFNFEYLKKISKFETSEDIENFEKAIYALVATKNPEFLLKLIDLFDDECTQPEIMYTLIHILETYPDEIYVQCVLKKLKHGLEHYTEWILVLIYRILNNQSCQIFFIQNMHLAQKKALSQLFGLIDVNYNPTLMFDLKKRLEELGSKM